MTAKLAASADGTKVYLGNASENALELDATGKTIKPVAPYVFSAPLNRVAFFATQPTDPGLAFPNNTVGKAVFTVEKYDLGNDYNAATSEFTAPVTGIYTFSAGVEWHASFTGSKFTWLRIYRGGIGTPEDYLITFAEGAGYGTEQGNLTLRLAAGDIVQVAMQQSSGSTYFQGWGPTKLYFSGTLVQPDAGV